MLDKITVTDGKLDENKKIVGRKPAKLSAIQTFKTKASNLRQSIKNKNVSETPTPVAPEITKPVETKSEPTTQPVASNNTTPDNVVNFPDAVECEKRLTNKGVTCTNKALINNLTSSRKLRVAAKVIEFTENVKNHAQKVELSINQPKDDVKNIYDFSKSFEAMTPNETKEEVKTSEVAEEKPYSWLRNEDTTINKTSKEGGNIVDFQAWKEQRPTTISKTTMNSETKEDSNVVEFQTLMEQKASTADSLATQKEILMNLRKQVEQNNALCEAKKRELIEENMALTQELNDVLAEINQLSDTVSQQEAFLGIADEESKEMTA